MISPSTSLVGEATPPAVWLSTYRRSLDALEGDVVTKYHMFLGVESLVRFIIPLTEVWFGTVPGTVPGVPQWVSAAGGDHTGGGRE